VVDDDELVDEVEVVEDVEDVVVDVEAVNNVEDVVDVAVLDTK
jgi:hypothetical protein